MLRRTDVKRQIANFLFVLVAALSVACGKLDSSETNLSTIDNQVNILLKGQAKDGRYVSVKLDNHGMHLTWGGESRYFSDSTKVVAEFLAGKPAALDPFFGRALLTSKKNITVQLVDKKSWPRSAELSVSGAGPAETVELKAAAPGSEFTVVSYNPENVFDQTDEERNQSYGDYRIEPNSQGYSSNWGEPTSCTLTKTKNCSFTDVKIENIRKALLAIDPAGPEVVALQEIESAEATEMLFRAVKDLGYVAGEFSSWPNPADPQAIGMAILSKYPVKAKSLLSIGSANEARDSNGGGKRSQAKRDNRGNKGKRNGIIDMSMATALRPRGEHQRPVFRVTLDVHGHSLVVYINHWRSKGAPESYRIVSAEAIEADLVKTLSKEPALDYLIVGDLNCNYNEKDTLEDRHNDTNGRTGINDVLKAQGDEALMTNDDGNKLRKYNFIYELDEDDRRTAYHEGFGWSTFDHIIGGKGLYDNKGVTYIDNSHTIADARYDAVNFLFQSNGQTKRWFSQRRGNKTVHSTGGYSDHAPVFARFHLN